MKSFSELKVWNKAHELVLLIYKLTSKFSSDERFGLSSQMGRAAVSIASNIAEGFKRNYIKVSLNFYNIASGSTEEIKYQLLLSKDLNYIELDQYNNALSLSEEVSKMLNAWSKSQRR